MNKIVLSFFLLILVFTSCNFEEKVEHIVESTVEQERVIDISVQIPSINIIGNQKEIKIKLNTAPIKKLIEDDRIEQAIAIVNQLTLSVPNQSFNFLESVNLEINSDKLENTVLANFDNFTKDVKELNLDIISTENLIQLLDDDYLIFKVNYAANQFLKEPIELNFSFRFSIDYDYEFESPF